MSTRALGHPELRVQHHRWGARRIAGSTIVTALLIAMAAYFLFPIVWLLVSTTKDQQQLLNLGILQVGQPAHLFQNIAQLSTFRGDQYWRWYLNTFIYASSIGVFATLFCAMAGFALVKYRFKGQSVVYWMVLASLMIPGAVTVIPLFILERAMGIMDTYWAVILPQLVNPFGAFFMTVYIAEVFPDELLEAARVDGASRFRTFFRIVVPVIMPGIVTLLLIVFIGAWNNFFLPFLVLNQPHLYPITVGLSSWLSEISQNGQAGISWYSLITTGATLSVLPMLVLFPFLSRYIVAGLSQGSAKL